MSATANRELYRKVFKNTDVVFHDCGSVENIGNIIQFNVNASRNFIERVPEFYDIVKARVKKFIQQKNPNMDIDEIDEKVEKMPIISFKAFKDKIPDAEHWYGKNAGTNKYTGQDIIVAGTPHYPEFVYKLLAYTLGFDFNKGANFRYQQVIRDEYKYDFWFTTFDDKVLQNIQFHLIGSEIEQTVGRARLNRNNCTVYLFSDLLLNQSKIEDFDIGIDL
jgi:hypothetical protein